MINSDMLEVVISSLIFSLMVGRMHGILGLVACICDAYRRLMIGARSQVIPSLCESIATMLNMPVASHSALLDLQ